MSQPGETHIVQILGPNQYGLKIDHPASCKPWSCSLYAAMTTRHTETPAGRYQATLAAGTWALEPVGWARPEDHATAVRQTQHWRAVIAATKAVEQVLRDVGGPLAGDVVACHVAWRCGGDRAG